MNLNRRSLMAFVLAELLLAMAAVGWNSTNRVVRVPASQTSTDLVARSPDPTDALGNAVTTTTLAGAAGTGPGGVVGRPSTTVRPGAPGGPAGSGYPSAGFTGPGVTATEIKIGITLVQTGTIVGDVTGVPVDFGDTRAQATAVIDYLNKNGGIAGRKVVPVYYTFDLARPGLADGQSEQEACSAWTEDNRVFAALNSALARQSLLVCLAGRGVPGIHNGLPVDAETFNKYRDYWYAGFGGAAITLDHLAEKEVREFAAEGFFNGPNTVVGIEHFDDPAYKRVVDQIFKPLLAKAGIKKVVTQAAPRGGVEATSYVTNFRREGVTHVFFLGEAGLYPLFFMRAAQNQQYFPRYGLTTDHALAAQLQPGAPAKQLANAWALGWSPAVDVDNAHDPGPVSPRNALCLDIQRKAGQDMSNRGALITAIAYCDELFMLQQALAPVKEITVAGLSAGFNALGTSYQSAGIFGTRFGPNNHDAVDAYRDVRFTTDCNCFHYTSGTKPFS